MIRKFGLGLAESVTQYFLLNSWTLDAPSGFYYSDIDIGGSELSGTYPQTTCYRNSDGEIILPNKVDRLDAYTLRVWMPVNTETLNVACTY